MGDSVQLVRFIVMEDPASPAGRIASFFDAGVFRNPVVRVGDCRAVSEAISTAARMGAAPVLVIDGSSRAFDIDRVLAELRAGFPNPISAVVVTDSSAGDDASQSWANSGASICPADSLSEARLLRALSMAGCRVAVMAPDPEGMPAC